MEYSVFDMDKYGMLVEALARWISRAPTVPLAFAASDDSGPIRTRPMPLLELLLVVRGEIRLDVKGVAGRLVAGDCALINAHFGNRGDPVGAGGGSWCYACVSVNIAGAPALRDAGRRPLFEVRAMEHPAPLHQLYRDVAQQAHAPSPYLGAVQLKAAVLRLLAALYGSGRGLTAVAAPAGDRRLQAALALVRERQADPTLRVTDLARAAGLSPDHLGRLFRRECGLSPMPYLMQLRLSRARSLLRHAELSVKEVAFMTGFSDPLYFSRLFRHTFGHPPSRKERL